MGGGRRTLSLAKSHSMLWLVFVFLYGDVRVNRYIHNSTHLKGYLLIWRQEEGWGLAEFSVVEG
jgi:hypothetical protein